MPGMDPDLTIGTTDPKLTAYLVQRFLIILPVLVRTNQPLALNASKWSFRKLEVWFDRGGHLELAYPGGGFRMFIPAPQAAEFIRLLGSSEPQVRSLVHVASKWNGASWQRFALYGDDVEMLAYCVAPEEGGLIAILETEDRRRLLQAFGEYQIKHPPPAEPAPLPAEEKEKAPTP